MSDTPPKSHASHDQPRAGLTALRALAAAVTLLAPAAFVGSSGRPAVGGEPPLVAPDPAPAPVVIRLQAGKTLRFHAAYVRHGPEGMESTVAYELSVETLMALPSGGGEVRVRFSDVNGWMGEGSHLANTRWTAGKVPASVRAMIEVDAACVCASSKLDVSIDPTGNVTSVRGLEELLAKASQTLPGETRRAVLAMALAFLPPVRWSRSADESWTAPDAAPGFTWWAKRAGAALVRVSAQCSPDGTPQPHGRLGGSWTAFVSPSDGLPLRSDTETRVGFLQVTSGNGRKTEDDIEKREVATVERMFAAPPPVRLVPGAVSKATLRIRSSERLGPSASEAGFDDSAEHEWTITALPPGAGGAPRASLAFTHTVASGSVTTGPGKTVAWEHDTGREMPATGAARLQAAAAGAFVGGTFTVEFNPAGGVANVTGIEAACAAAATRMGLASDESGIVALTVTKERLLTMLDAAFPGTHPADGGPIHVVTSELPAHRFMSISVEWSRIRDASDPAKFVAEGTPSLWLLMAKGAATPHSVALNRARGSTSFSSADGLPLRSSAAVEAEGTSISGGRPTPARASISIEFTRTEPTPPK